MVANWWAVDPFGSFVFVIKVKTKVIKVDKLKVWSRQVFIHVFGPRDPLLGHIVVRGRMGMLKSLCFKLCYTVLWIQNER